MGLARIDSAAFLGLDAVRVEVEVDAMSEAQFASIVVVGLPDAAVRESKDRVLAALRNSRFPIGQISCTINLAPGDLKKEGVLYDLPIAIGLLRSLNRISSNTHESYLMVGEVGLSGEMRPIRGALAMAMLARKLGKKGIMLPEANAQEAAAVPDVDVIPLSSLKDAVQFLENKKTIPSFPKSVTEGLFSATQPPPIDFADVKGQDHAKRAMEITAAGGHNILMSGPPGSGKTMIAKSLIGIMPPLTVEEALETTKIHSISGMLKEGRSLITQRPFRSPHHTVSYAGLIGGGTNPRPGEVSLAHNGILFLDELPEFARATLEVLRQPLEDRCVTISRANGNFTFPTSFICIAAMNPCPCGNLTHTDKVCICTETQIHRYKGRISGPLLDRIDIHLEIPALRYREIVEGPAGESSEVVKQRVIQARSVQCRRFEAQKVNAQMSPKEMKKYCALDVSCRDLLRQAIDVMGVSARAHDRILRVARTIADLEGAEHISREHLMEAIHYRTVIENTKTCFSPCHH